MLANPHLLFYPWKCCFPQFLLSKPCQGGHQKEWKHKVKLCTAGGGKAAPASCPQASVGLSMVSSHFSFFFRVIVFPKDGKIYSGSQGGSPVLWTGWAGTQTSQLSPLDRAATDEIGILGSLNANCVSVATYYYVPAAAPISNTGLLCLSSDLKDKKYQFLG